MKRTKLQFLFLLLFLIHTGHSYISAQRMGQPNAISFKRVFANYLAPYSDGASLKNYTAVWEAAYHRQIWNKGINIVVPVRVGVARFKDSITNTPFFGGDLQLQYQFIKDKLPVSPYVFAGVGFAKEMNGSTGVEIPLGVGLEIYFNRNAALQIFGSYRHGVEDYRKNLQHGVGFKYILGNGDQKPKEVEIKVMDKDGDGVLDDDDKCPTIAGLKRFNGCPDSDGDGIPENEDLCPTVAGPIETKGCPDRDKDGIADFQDECPDVFGVKAKKGCPESIADLDTDGDGVNDSKDKCPTLAGLKYLNGCPDSDDDGVADIDDKCPTISGKKELKGCPDSDGDGLSDIDDKCPLAAGPLSNKGCPEIKKEEKEILDFAMKAVQFDLGKWTLRPESNPILDKIVKILQKYPEYSLAIYGHTDNTGKAETNEKLSTSRARTCYEYLVSKGISARRLIYKGFGAQHPLYPNTTEQNKILNRRVEFIMSVE